MTDMTAKKEL